MKLVSDIILVTYHTQEKNLKKMRSIQTSVTLLLALGPVLLLVYQSLNIPIVSYTWTLIKCVAEE